MADEDDVVMVRTATLTLTLSPQAQVVGMVLGILAGLGSLYALRALCGGCGVFDESSSRKRRKRSARAMVREAELRIRHGRRGHRALPVDDSDEHLSDGSN